jgi:hypothetical protein
VVIKDVALFVVTFIPSPFLECKDVNNFPFLARHMVTLQINVTKIVKITGSDKSRVSKLNLILGRRI